MDVWMLAALHVQPMGRIAKPSIPINLEEFEPANQPL